MDESGEDEEEPEEEEERRRRRWRRLVVNRVWLVVNREVLLATSPVLVGRLLPATPPTLGFCLSAGWGGGMGG